MKKIKWIILLLIFVSIASISILSVQQNALDVNHQGDLVRNYTFDLHDQRENCYSKILLLGTLNEQQVKQAKQDLTHYLNELEKINHSIQNAGIDNHNLNNSIELDILLMKKTLTAIVTKDESYLVGLSEIYHYLLEYQKLLNV